MKQEIHAVIFDLDGTLANSEPVYRQTEHWLAEHLNVAFAEQGPNDFVSVSTEEYMECLRQHHELDIPTEELCKLQTRLFLKKGIEKVRPFNPTIDFLKSLHINQIPSGLASDSEKEIIQAILRQLRLEPYFQVTLSSCEVGSGKPKPAPDVFLECARQLKIAPGFCLVLEDSVVGMRAAKSAGMAVITIDSQPPATNSRKNQYLAELRQADLHFACMEEFNLMPILNQFDIRRRAKGNHEITRKVAKGHEI